MANRNVLAIGTSAGGVEALRYLASRFPADLPASVLITIHLPREFRSNLDSILSGAGPLAAAFAENGESLRKSRIYLAPAGRHLLIDGERLWLGTGPRENHARPAIDPMLRSAAVCCGPRSVGVILTGALSDGAAGLSALKRCGGRTVVQDPQDAVFQEMPTTAMNQVKPDNVIGLAEMPALLESLVREPAGQRTPIPLNLKYEVEIAKGGRMSMDDMDRIGRRSVLVCPDCGGTMWEIDNGELVRYRCHEGHAYTSELMSMAVDENLRRTLASALRVLAERIALATRLGTDARERGRETLANSWDMQVEEFEQQAKLIRDSLSRIDQLITRFQADEQLARTQPERAAG
jgi:two-component system, chemotaxis family, protein-glutamate methylesterase/glutaminase